jgi:predicted dienelactone hydrolase
MPATEPGSPGSFAVGVRTATVHDAGRPDRTLVCEIWYPVAPGAVPQDAALASYDFLPTVRPPARIAVGGDQPVAPGEFPLVVYSHGSGGTRFIASYFTEVLASHGFVVVAADHSGDTAVDAFLGAAVDEHENLRLRPRDVSVVLDAVLAAESDLAWLEGHVDPTRIGVAGHSFGGTTGLALAGGTASSPADARVRAIVGMAAYTRLLDDGTLRAADVPLLLVSGTSDGSTPIALDTERPWDLVPGRPLLRVDLARAGHQSFTDVCAYRDLLDTVPDLPQALRDAVQAYAADGCGPGLLDIDTALRLTNRYAVAFLLRWVAGDASAERWLAEPEDPADASVVEVRRHEPPTARRRPGLPEVRPARRR